MAREPAARYATARDLAHDLQAFLDDRPIRARRTPPLARAWRWCRRNPAVASLAASTAAALVLAGAAGWVGYARTTDALGREADRRQDAEHAQVRAEAAKTDADRATAAAEQMSDRLKANLKLSLLTFEKVLEAAGGSGPERGFGGPPGGGRGPDRGFGPPGGDRPPPSGGAGGPGAELASDKAAILEAVLAFYDEFAAQNAPDPALRLEAAKASRRVCEANVWLKRPDKAAAAFRRAVALLEPLVAAFPDNDAMRTELALAYLDAPPAERDVRLSRALELARGDERLTAVVQSRLSGAREPSGSFGGRPWGGKKDGPPRKN